MRRALLFVLALVSGCYHLPIWHGDVTVQPLAREAVKTCGTGALTDAGRARITRIPYLQSTTTSSTIVVWGSTDGHGVVVLREPGGEIIKNVQATYAGDPARAAARLAAQHPTGKPLAADDIYVVKSELTGLAATHLYCYQLVADGVPLTEPAPLTTAATPGRPADQPIRFVAVGDTGTGGAAEIAIAKQMSAVPFDFMLFLGDIAYESGTAAQLQNAFFTIYRDFLHYVPAYPTLGNHERRTHRGRPYLEAFVLPEPENYYSFDWGDVHFVSIDTTHRESKQLVWLDEDLKKNKLPWVIVFGHHPMYTNSLRGPEMWIRRAFAKIVTLHRVDLVLTGHEHQYERFKVAGVNYVISGGGGGQLTHFWERSRALKQKEVHHFLAFEVTATTLTMRAIDITGKEIETLHLTKSSSGRVKTKVDGKPDERSTPVPAEKSTVPDEQLHDEPDDDKHRPNKAPSDPTPATTTSVPPAPSPVPPPAAAPTVPPAQKTATAPTR